MCTVTYIPGRDSIFLTTNRDEQLQRSNAVPPAIRQFTSGRIIFPKDGDAGGTWIAGHENGNAVVFLNGAETAHTPEPPYRKSRGLILLDLIDHFTPFNCFMAIKLNNIEPFTAIIYDNQHLFECRWDGKQKQATELDPATPYIWSSSTLYDKTATEKRKKWFEEWIKAKPQPDQENILHFHQFTGDGDKKNDLLMNRDEKVYTVSITSVDITESSIFMEYLNIKDATRFSEQLSLETTFTGQ